MKICALIPVHNEEKNIQDVVKSVKQHIEDIVVINDGSDDGTASVLEELNITVLSNPVNMGKGVALRKGLNYVLERDFSHVLFMDGDGQHSARSLPDFIKSAEKFDFVLGSRMTNKELIPKARYRTNKLGSYILSEITGKELTDGQSGYRMISTELLKKIKLTAIGFEIETEILIKCCAQGCSFTEIDIEAIYRHNGISHYRWFVDTWNICFAALNYKWGG